MSKIIHFQPGNDVICATPTAPLRSNAAEISELETQMLYGERAIIDSIGPNDWIQITTASDNYTAWADKKHFIEWEGKQHIYVSTTPIQQIQGHFGTTLIPFGSLLTKDEISSKSIYQPIDKPANITPEKLVSMAKLFLNAPYLWGGKTIMGIDCSGFIQLVFISFNIMLPRNASQQQTNGDEVPFNQAKAGDIAFFQNNDASVIHTGILLPGNKIIHASGFVRIDTFSSEGIIHIETKKLTHRLHSIKRLFTKT